MLVIFARPVRFVPSPHPTPRHILMLGQGSCEWERDVTQDDPTVFHSPLPCALNQRGIVGDSVTPTFCIGGVNLSLPISVAPRLKEFGFYWFQLALLRPKGLDVAVTERFDTPPCLA